MFLSTYVKVQSLLTEFKNDERGVTAIEYAVVAVAVATVVAVVFGSGTEGPLFDVIDGLLGDVAAIFD
ncbi:Flp family type IVb pilin [Vibrio algarum]|uniref:Flp family type IVb pilin n=1 Tax=Vibrio algarum TaxID=3020714 RepID=A0ABT4YPK3_9VIBR|nr:Flp family type IVb pilin [Vibrio sp. KJ40-1]MDB1123126.1 Flp family type IVb pilin [Vibrio sp. KJ40-1]